MIAEIQPYLGAIFIGSISFVLALVLYLEVRFYDD